MGLKAEEVLAVSMKYTDESIAGGGVSAGKNCKIQSITSITGGKRVTFLWSLDDGTEKTSTMDVMDGTDGESAYELAVDEGYTGTLEEWLASLKGEKGDKGDKGDTGEGLPAGGATGQVLVKKSGTDYDTEWNTPAGGGDMLKSIYDSDDDGKVDAAEDADTVSGHSVGCDVPSNAVFTDTVYDDTEIKGEIADKVDKVTGKGLSTEDYTTAEQTKLSGIEAGAQVNVIEAISLNGTDVAPDANKKVALTVITKAVNDLVNYYLKSETYSKTEVDNIVTAVKNSRFEVVSSLPTTDIKTNVIYLVPKATAQTDNAKDEYINLDGTTAGWEKIGDTEIDLSGYVTTSALSTTLADYVTTTALNTALADYVTSTSLATTLADYVTSASLATTLDDYATKTYVGDAITAAGMVEFYHNIPRKTPKDITSYVTDGTIWKRLNGTDGFELYEDLYAGDYFQMSRAITAPNQDSQYATTGSDWVTIAGIDTRMGDGDGGDSVAVINYHHLVMVPGKGFGGTQHFGRKRMNSSNDTTGGYVASEMHTATIGAVASSGSTASGATINQQLYAEFGSHLKTTRELLTNTLNATGYNKFGTNSGCSSNWAWTSCQAVLMSEVECYGSTVWSSAGYDTGNACDQLPLFRHNKEARNNRSGYYWLKDIASAANFCRCDHNGDAACYHASYAAAYVRPRFILAA